MKTGSQKDFPFSDGAEAPPLCVDYAASIRLPAEPLHKLLRVSCLA